MRSKMVNQCHKYFCCLVDHSIIFNLSNLSERNKQKLKYCTSIHCNSLVELTEKSQQIKCKWMVQQQFIQKYA